MTTAALPEVFAGLEMPKAGLRRWFILSWKACHAHGGPRHYRELIDLYEACLGALEGPIDRTALAAPRPRFSREEPPKRVSLRMNSLFMVTQMGIDAVDHPWVHRYRDALVLGALREDVAYIPLLGKVWEHLSFSHFYREGIPGGIIPFVWPGPRLKANLFFRRALRLHRAGAHAAACVQIGRILHLVADMCCPVHAHTVVHATDPYEWYLEANKNTLIQLPPAEVPKLARASECVAGVARAAQRFRPDATNHLPGKVLKRMGLRRSVFRAEVAEQARAMIPVGAAHAAALLALFVRSAAPPAC